MKVVASISLLLSPLLQLRSRRPSLRRSKAFGETRSAARSLKSPPAASSLCGTVVWASARGQAGGFATTTSNVVGTQRPHRAQMTTTAIGPDPCSSPTTTFTSPRSSCSLDDQPNAQLTGCGLMWTHSQDADLDPGRRTVALTGLAEPVHAEAS